MYVLKKSLWFMPNSNQWQQKKKNNETPRRYLKSLSFALLYTTSKEPSPHTEQTYHDQSYGLRIMKYIIAEKKHEQQRKRGNRTVARCNVAATHGQCGAYQEWHPWRRFDADLLPYGGNHQNNVKHSGFTVTWFALSSPSKLVLDDSTGIPKHKKLASWVLQAPLCGPNLARRF